MESAVHSLIGHGATWDLLERLSGAGRLPTAILLAGPPMVGKRTLLECLARLLLCETGSNCGMCVICRTSLAQHPDVFSHIPGEQEDNRGSVVGLLRRLRERPSLGQAVIGFLEDLDRFSPSALALLLKAIEDAPPYAHLFLTARELERVPDTIRSRALVRILAPPPLDKLAAALTDRGNAAENSREVAILAGGRPGLALRLLRDRDLRAQYHRTRDRLGKLPSYSVAERSAMAAEIEREEDATEVLDLYQTVLREQLRGSVRERDTASLPSPRELRKSREARAMLRANVPPRLALEYAFFSVPGS